MREIKFRARDLNDRLWYFSAFEIEGSDPDGEHFFIAEHSALMVKETLEEWTGLKDKNGVEIYEGDIVNIKILDAYTGELRSFTGVVEYYSASKCEYLVRCKALIGLETMELVDEVIGNIYSNPELLEQDNE